MPPVPSKENLVERLSALPHIPRSTLQHLDLAIRAIERGERAAHLQREAAEARAALKERREQLVSEFITAETEFGDGLSAPANKVYSAYTKWVRGRGTKEDERATEPKLCELLLKIDGVEQGTVRDEGLTFIGHAHGFVGLALKQPDAADGADGDGADDTDGAEADAELVEQGK